MTRAIDTPHRPSEPRQAARAVLLAAAIAVASTDAAGQRDAKPAAPAPAAGAIRGAVVGSDTGQPIRDAVVVLRALDQAESEVRTTVVGGSGRATFGLQYSGMGQVDDEGRFELTGVLPGRYRLTVMPGPSALRYIQTTYPDVDEQELPPLTVSAGQVVENARIAMLRAGAISGRILTARGDPLSEVVIQAIDALPGGHRNMTMAWLGPTVVERTDDNGQFRIYGLRPGEYILRAQAQLRAPVGIVPPGGPAQLLTIMRGASTLVYYPGTTSPADAVRIKLQAGEERTAVDFVLSEAKQITVRGVLVDPEGQPAGGMDVRVQRPGGTLGETGFARPASGDGSFELTGLFPGDHVLTAHRFGDGTRPAQFAWLPLPLHDDLEGVVLHLQNAVTIRGQVTFEGEPPPSWGRLQITAVPSRTNTGRNSSGAQPDAARKFELGNQFGPMFLRADGMPDWHLKSVTYNGADITDEPTEFDGRTPVEVVLTQRAAALTGTVTTPKGTPVDAGIVVFSDQRAAWHERALSTRLVFSSLAGTFTVKGLRPGRYLAIALNRADAALTNAPASYFEALAQHATPVTIDEAEQKSLKLTIVSLR